MGPSPATGGVIAAVCCLRHGHAKRIGLSLKGKVLQEFQCIQQERKKSVKGVYG